MSFFSVCILTLAFLMSTSTSFDLNEPAAIESCELMPPDDQKPTVRRVQCKISPKFYKKVEALFKILSICDDENFDIEKIELPENFDAQNKAVLALKKVAKAKLIKKDDKERYMRIIKNCAAINAAIQDKDASFLIVDSQASGENYSEWYRLHELAEQSPLDEIRDRFVVPTVEQEQAKGVMPKNVLFEPLQNTAKEMSEKPKILGKLRTTEDYANSPPPETFFRFL